MMDKNHSGNCTASIEEFEAYHTTVELTIGSAASSSASSGDQGNKMNPKLGKL